MDVERLMFKPGLMHGERVLVTGGGSGLGKVMAEACLAVGAEVFIAGRREAVLAETVTELTGRHGGVMKAHVCDIRDTDAVDAMLDAIWADGGPLTGLVNNAAGNFVSRTEDLSIGGFDAIANIVMRGSFYLTQQCGKRWLDDGVPASVVSILVTWVWNGSPFTVPSAMAKSAVNAMTQSLAVEWGHRGIRLNAIAPGLFPTEGATQQLHPGETVQTRERDDPFIRFGDMTELANLAVFLLSPGAEFLTGQTIAIDGGAYQAHGANFAKLRARSPEEWQAVRRTAPPRTPKPRPTGS